MTGGNFGEYLRVELGSSVATRVAIPPEVSSNLVGGVGIATWLLLRETPPGLDPLGPDATIVFAFGPLLGTPLTTSAKFALVAKSPLTGRLTDGLSSSHFALAAKRLGVDAIVLRGRAPRPSILLLDERDASLEPAGDLWGRGLAVSEAARVLAARFPEHRFALIGVAGENLVRYAGVVNDGRHAGAGGLGAVLGAMRLKAVGARGERRVPLADARSTIALSKALARRSLGASELGSVGGPAAIEGLEARRRGRGSCAGCNIRCAQFFELAPGEAPVRAKHANVFALGPLCGIRDPEVVLRASRACDELGLDAISAGESIALAMECGERGLLADSPFADDARGLAAGDGARLLTLLDDIARRRGPLADILAEGSRRAAERIGVPAPDFHHERRGSAQSEDRAAILDSLILCNFLSGTFVDLFVESAEMLAAVTGLPRDAAELRRAARRIVLLKRRFDEREGWTAVDDTPPERFYTEALNARS